MNYFQRKDAHSITCLLCQHYCTLKENAHGICGINYNKENTLVNTTYGHPSAINIDPIEKKPLYHFLPATQSLSIGTVGCNFRCPFCQNYTISQTATVNEQITYTPKNIVALAQKYKTKSISYTYNEPTIWYPYAKDIGTLAKESGIKNIFVSSGYESKEVLEDMPSWLDAINVDLKSFSHEYYKKVLKTNLDGVKESLELLAQSPIWLEITTLIIPDVNDSDAELHAMAEFIATKIGVETPWHLSAFYPNYKMQDTPSTSLKTLQRAKEIAQSHGIKYIYIGNILNDTSTYCEKCGTRLIHREGYKTQVENLKGNHCKVCNNFVAGVFS